VYDDFIVLYLNIVSLFAGRDCVYPKIPALMHDRTGIKNTPSARQFTVFSFDPCLLLLQNALCIYSSIWWDNDFQLKILRKSEVNVFGAISHFYVVRNLCIPYCYCPHRTHLRIVSAPIDAYDQAKKHNIKYGYSEEAIGEAEHGEEEGLRPQELWVEG
jgi:hypothetical protein